MSSDVSGILNEHVRSYVLRYLIKNYLNTKIGEGLLAKWWSKAEELGISDPRILLAYVIASIEYDVWLYDGGDEILRLAQKCNSQAALRRLSKRAPSKELIERESITLSGFLRVPSTNAS